LDQAAELDPLAPIIALCRGYPASYQGHVEPAIRAAREALAISPAFPAALEDLMTYFERQGRHEEAMQQAVALLHARAQHELAEAVQVAYRLSGYQTALRTWFEAEEDRAAREYVSPLRIAILAMRVGNLDKAFSWLNRAVEDRNAGLVYLTVDPKYARLRSDPRFSGIAGRVGLKLRTR
jgi:tetratricopeptide (TPR) repeat protein